MSVGRMTMAEKNSKSVPIKGLTDKRNITLTFVVSLAGEFFADASDLPGKNKSKSSSKLCISKGILSYAKPKTLLKRRGNS